MGRESPSERFIESKAPGLNDRPASRLQPRDTELSENGQQLLAPGLERIFRDHMINETKRLRSLCRQ